MNRREFFAAAAVLPMVAGQSNQFVGISEEVVAVPAFLVEPAYSGDVWKIVDEIAETIDRRRGLTDVFYGVTNDPNWGRRAGETYGRPKVQE